MVAGYDREGAGANAIKPLIDKVELLVQALGEATENVRPGLLVPRGEALRQFRELQAKRDIDFDIPILGDSAREALNVLVAAYNVFVSLDPELARRDEMALGPDARSMLLAPSEGSKVVSDAAKLGAATFGAEKALAEEAQVAPSTPVPSDRNSRRYSESLKNFSRAVLSNAHALANAVWANRVRVSLGTAGIASGIVAAGKWAISNEAWLLQTFSQNRDARNYIKGNSCSFLSHCHLGPLDTPHPTRS